MPTDPEQRFRALISYDDALRAIAAGMAFAKERNLTLSFVVVDPAGHLVAAGRMDGAPFIAIEIARGKAFASAATGGQSGRSLAMRYEDNPMVWGAASPLGYGAPMLVAAGSLPIWRGGLLLGSMGASGAAASDLDDAAVELAIRSIGAQSNR
jgi:glc operon protein GlcG